jgi:hypothetical protein
MISKDMNPLDVVYKYGETEQVFRSYDPPGKCILCDHLFDSIESIAARYDFDADELLKKLNDAIIPEETGDSRD